VLFDVDFSGGRLRRAVARVGRSWPILPQSATNVVILHELAKSATRFSRKFVTYIEIFRVRASNYPCSIRLKALKKSGK
jgi:hypothetical protein